ncbi:MAG TPA: flagellar hook-associated protein FlgK [Fimbriimonas sp.]|nr:flagellar hook-associated protein FlgK [Fimbriimonas sp.]
MPSPFQGIETASRALRAFQRSLDTTSNNIANVNTAGYTRQVVELTPTDPGHEYARKLLTIGSGVNVSEINRIRDNQLEHRRHTAFSEQGRSEASLGNLEKVQSTFLDVQGKGISTALDTFFNAWSAMGSDPTSASAKLEVQNAGRDLSKKISNAYQELSGISTSQDEQIQATLVDIQRLSEDIGQLNSEIKKQLAQGGEPNDLFDARDTVIAELSQLINVSTHAASDGTISVFSGNLTLVDQVGARDFPTTYDAATSTVTNSISTWNVSGGKLKGLFDNANTFDTYLTQLDSLANTLRDEVNSIHMSGYTSTGATGQRFFNDSVPQTGAANFALDANIEASVDNIALGATNAAGDGSIGLGISALRDTKLTNLGNKTFKNYFSDVLTGVGRAVTVAKTNLETAYALTEQVEAQIQDVSGVNLDDEMAEMLKYQRSYQAAAKVLNVMDQTIGDLIDMLRR